MMFSKIGFVKYSELILRFMPSISLLFVFYANHNRNSVTESLSVLIPLSFFALWAVVNNIAVKHFNLDV